MSNIHAANRMAALERENAALRAEILTLRNAIAESPTSDMGSSAAFRCCGFSDTPCPSFAESCQNPRNYPCLRCKGAGSIEVDDTTSGPDGGRYEVACPACDGIGVRGFQREPNTPATNMHCKPARYCPVCGASGDKVGEAGAACWTEGCEGVVRSNLK